MKKFSHQTIYEQMSLFDKHSSQNSTQSGKEPMKQSHKTFTERIATFLKQIEEFAEPIKKIASAIASVCFAIKGIRSVFSKAGTAPVGGYAI